MYAMQTDDSSALDGNKSICYHSYSQKGLTYYPSDRTETRTGDV